MKPKGSVFKIKSGYNPNSSSIGTEISIFLKGAAGFALLVNLLFAIVSSIQRKKNGNKKKE